MKISIHYYSGAGNTRYIAKKLAKSFRNNTHSVSDAKISANGNADGIDDDFDMLGVGFPIYFRDAPQLATDLLRQIDGKNRPIFFFCTKGLYSGNAIRNMMALATDQNFQTVGSIEFFMPGTDVLILFTKKDSITERLFKRIHSRHIDEKIKRFVVTVTAAVLGNAPVKTSFRKWYTFFDDYVVKKLETRYNNHYMDYVGQFYSNPDSCIECMKCIRGCPRHNIVWDEQIKFGNNCDVCFNCIHHCPTNSIQIGKMTEGNVRYSQVELL